MSGNNVDISITGSDAGMMQVWQREQREMQKSIDRMEKLSRTGKKASKDTKRGFDSALGSVKQFSHNLLGTIGAVGGVTSGIALLRAELENLRRLNKKDANVQVPFQDSMVQAYKNSGGLFEPKELERKVIAIEKKTGVSPAKIAEAISSAFSAKGPKNQAEAEDAIKSTIAALKFSPKISGGDLADLTGAGIDLSKRFGFTPEQSLGFLQSVGGQARVVEPNMLANNAAPAIANLSSFGNTATESGALIAALTQGATDKTAAMTGTSAISLAAQLKERGIGKTTAEGIELLAADPELRKRFLEGGKFDGKKHPKASFEKNASVAIQQLFDPGSVTRDAYLGAKNAIGGKKEAQATYDLNVKAAGILAPTSDLRRESEAASETASIGSKISALKAESRDVVSRALDDAKYGWFDQKFLKTEFEAKLLTSDQDPRLVASEFLKLERDRNLMQGRFKMDRMLPQSSGLFDISGSIPDALNQKALEGTNFLSSGFLKMPEEKGPPAHAVVAADKLQRQIVILLDSLQRDRDQQKKATEAMEDVAKALKQQPSPATSTAVPPPRRREPFKLPAEKLNRGDR
ncbi:hypothetical protein [Gimesia algae]|uniref:Phage-related minor tail protein n=1 Tax=Gimesia algae TaxID=2527971 RepID=A0A517V859_9PLAN|nr:hypothetical protein [Gimesia algae]QDT89169.1 hypothetical protein Pan161_07950 [Gimesia algae]